MDSYRAWAGAALAAWAGACSSNGSADSASGPATTSGSGAASASTSSGAGGQGGAAVMPQENGASCGQAAECKSGFCVDKVCCGDACTGVCQTCGKPGSKGACVAVDIGTDPDKECNGGVCGGKSACAMSASTLWCRTYGSSAKDAGYSVAVDKSGSAIVAGSFSAGASFGGNVLPYAGGPSDTVLAKYDAGGNHQWSNGYGGPGDDPPAGGVAVDTNGNIALGARFDKPANFGCGALKGGTEPYDLVASYQPNGMCRWSKSYGSSTSPDSSTYAVAFDNAGNVLATGNFMGTVDFGAGPPAVGGSFGHNAFLLKLEPGAGGTTWVKTFGQNSGQVQGIGVAAAGGGDPLLIGGFNGTVDSFVKTLSHTTDWAGVLQRDAATTGAPLWSIPISGAYAGGAASIAVDFMGNIVVLGFVFEQQNGPLKFLIAKYEPTKGDLLWSKVVQPTKAAGQHGIAVDAKGNVIASGSFYGTIDFGKGPLMSAGNKDIWLVKYDPAGNPLWAKSFGGPGDDDVYGIAVDDAGAIRMTGSFQETVNFGDDKSPHTSAGSDDLFLCDLAP